MACFHPQEAAQAKTANKNGKRPVFMVGPKTVYDVDKYTQLSLKCGQCIGCRLDKSRDWAIRCIHETTLHAENSYLTLTYNDEHLPTDYSLRHRDFQLFMKRYRKKKIISSVTTWLANMAKPPKKTDK